MSEPKSGNAGRRWLYRFQSAASLSENKFKCENFPVADHGAVDVLFISFLPLHSRRMEWYALAENISSIYEGLSMVEFMKKWP